MLKLYTLAVAHIARLRKDEEGATAIEYGLLAALIAVAMIMGAGLLGTALDGIFTDVAGELGATAPGATPP